MRIATFLFLMFFIGASFASQPPKYKVNKFPNFKAHIHKMHIKNFQPLEQTSFAAKKSNVIKPTATNIKPLIMNSDHSTNVSIDSSRNGFGWLDARIRSVDRFKGNDASSVQSDFMVAGYRQYILGDPASGWIGATTVDVSNDLENGSFFRMTKLNQDLSDGTVGGRYPSAIALDRPFIAFNQYISGDASATPAISSPYLVTDYMSYGNNGGVMTPSMKMDEGYQHYNFDHNRLWTGSVSMVKSADGKYHYLGAYRNWTIAGENQPYEYVLLNAESGVQTGGFWDDDAGWTIDANPAVIDTMNFLIYPTVNMNASGFGVCVGIGHQGPHAGDTFYMSDLRLMIMKTTDYGKTWSTPREVSWAELGILETVAPSDSVWVWDTDSTGHYYEGDAYLAFVGNHGVDAMVSDNNDVYIAFDMTGGPQASDSTYYRHFNWCGLHVAVSTDGAENFTDHHAAINNGFFEGDSATSAVEDNLFMDSEADLSLDENGTLYATWLDRPHVNIEVAEHLRYNNPNETIGLKADIFTARSTDGGKTWGEKMNVTQTQHVDEYELKAAAHADSRNNGTVFYGYCTVDPNTSVAQGDPDAYTYRVNRVWLGEAHSYLTGIEHKSSTHSVKNFILEQNYPNPFNPSTMIEFRARRSGPAELTLYNITGQRIANLFKGSVHAGQNYRVDFDGKNLAAGVYFYRLKLGSTMQVKKMVLIK